MFSPQRTQRQFRHMALLFVMAALLICPAVAWAFEAPLAGDPFDEAPVLDLEDGTYAIDVTLEGGSGRAGITSPTTLTVKAGKAVATITWSSPNYDYMVVTGKRYLPLNEEGNSVFEIPVLALDAPFEVIGDTTAMSEPHEISYQLTFANDSLVRQGSPGIPMVVPLAVALLVVPCALVFLRLRSTR